MIIKTTISQKLILAILLVIGLVSASVMVVNTVEAQSGLRKGLSATETVDTSTGGVGVQIKRIVDLFLFIIGVLAVIMLIVGGIRYTVSNGDSNAITGAKNTILYAIVGLVVAILAYAIVGFVVGQF